MRDRASQYDALAPRRDALRRRYRYYHAEIARRYRFFIPEGKRVLEVGCSTGQLLNALKPAVGVGVDVSGASIALARRQFPHLSFHHGTIADLPDSGPFDYVILSGLVGELDDIQDFLIGLWRWCNRDTRVIIEYHSMLWQYVLSGAERLGLKMPVGTQNWLTATDIMNFIALTGFETVKQDRAVLLPLRIPLLSVVINRFFAKLPLLNALTLSHFIIARPVFGMREELSVSILVPCRNEKGNIEQAILRTPSFGARQEFIFVEGGSADGTFQEVDRVILKYPGKDIKLFKQPGKGKADAVRFGFAQATGEMLMILDADLTVPPEDLPKFTSIP